MNKKSLYLTFPISTHPSNCTPAISIALIQPSFTVPTFESPNAGDKILPSICRWASQFFLIIFAEEEPPSIPISNDSLGMQFFTGFIEWIKYSADTTTLEPFFLPFPRLRLMVALRRTIWNAAAGRLANGSRKDIRRHTPWTVNPSEEWAGLGRRAGVFSQMAKWETLSFFSWAMPWGYELKQFYCCIIYKCSTFVVCQSSLCHAHLRNAPDVRAPSSQWKNGRLDACGKLRSSVDEVLRIKAIVMILTLCFWSSQK